jgi:signal transduction histidine kinase
MVKYYVNFDLEVQDFGIGIPEDKLDSLFINFGKIDENSRKNKHGVGLGLSICKRLIDQMNGSVKVKSKVSEGTTFIINLKTICSVQENGNLNLSPSLKELLQVESKTHLENYERIQTPGNSILAIR